MISKRIKFTLFIIIALTALSACSPNTSTPAKELANYIDYSPETFEEIYQNNTVVLFFHAAWCPTCIAFEKEIINKNQEIPEGVVIVKADYDKEKELKKKHLITIQHTLVQLDEQGKTVSKWSGGGLDLLNQQIKL